MWQRRRDARTTTATLHDLGLGLRDAKQVAAQAKCGQLRPAELAIAASQLPRRRAARELLSWVAAVYKLGDALKGSAKRLGELSGCGERTAVRLVHDLERAGLVERHRRWTHCEGTDAECPLCEGRGAPHDRERASALTPGPGLLMALRAAGEARQARQRVAARLGRALKWPRHESRSATVADRRASPEGYARPGGRPSASPPQNQNPPLRGGCGAPSARSSDPEAARSEEHDSGHLGDDELRAALQGSLANAVAAARAGVPTHLRLRIPRPVYQRSPQRESETPCAALLSPRLYGPGGAAEGCCACPRCRGAS